MPPRFHHATLENGLTVIAESNDAAHTGAVGFFVKAGTRDEDAAVMGVSHFLEHMMFKGTDRRTADDVNREFDEIGANYNAYTSHESTVYYAQVLPEYLTRAIDLLGDMLRPALRQDDFDIEKNVILEEIGMYEDRPDWRLHDAILEKYFASHSLGYRVLGTVDSIKALRSQQMRDYFQHRYSADNITVAAAGRIDFDRLLEEVGGITEAWKPSGVERQYIDPQVAIGEQTIVDPKLNRHYVAIMCPGPSAQDPLRYAAKVMADVIGDSDGSRLYWALVDPGLADDASFDFHPQDRTGSFFAFATCDPDRREQVESILMKTIDDYASNINEAELERAKNKIATLATLGEESPGGRMRGLGHQWMYLGRYSSLAQELERVMAVTIQDVRDVIAQSRLRHRAIVRLGPR